MIASSTSTYLEPNNQRVSQRNLVNVALIEQGKSLYQAGKFLEAVQIFQQAVDFYQQQNDLLSLSISLNNLSLGHQALGQWTQAETAVNRSLQIARSINPQTTFSQAEVARALDTRGSLALLVGQPENAIDFWKEAATLYAQLGNVKAQIRNILNQEQALKSQGFYRRSLQVLEELLPRISSQPNSLVKAIALNYYGEMLSITGDLNLARQNLDSSLQMLQQLPDASNVENHEQQSNVLLNLANLARSEGRISEARKFYVQAASLTNQDFNRLQSQLNLLSLEIDASRLDKAMDLRSQIANKVIDLPASSSAIRAKINYGQNLLKLTQLASQAEHLSLRTESAKIFADSVKQAESINDQYTLAYALGSLGSVYEQNQQAEEAINLTERAIAISQSISASDIAYRWQWQLGRLLKVKGDIPSAIASYTEALKNLKQLRSDLAFINSNVQFSFRDSVEPVYRQLVGLLLQPDDSSQGGAIAQGVGDKQKNLLKAQNAIESLQLAELVNFFRADCLNAAQVDINKVDNTAAVVYPILLEDRLEVIISLPQQPLRHYSNPILPLEVDNVVSELRNDLRDASSLDYLEHSKKLYNWLIRPSENELAQAKVKTIVFVLDGSLRNIPMSALHDGNQFLMEKYSIALTPGLQLIDPKPIPRQKIAALTGGLTEAQQGFSALPSVVRELQEVKNQVPTSTVLLDNSFTKDNLEKALVNTPAPIIHLATHGSFSSQVENTFLLTYDGRLNIESLTKLLLSKRSLDSEPIELLILSACQTAVGDKRAALGMAGMAVRAGARSTIASLWAVDDEATSQFMISLYKSLSTASLTKAESLRLAQLALLKNKSYDHPYYWAPFVLLGNWL
ncbi:CHAT domain-containing protein [Pseudanabaena sp. FACHB-1998]|uniref:CHAT domain-containing protein n=1 Tax=Pseudanabaena sp. FACHB-1998 TaxID=2692858 RepID=UPI0016804E94|nr:CHAT domain-containing protein [Pseudanabaena sp. FACHB-1998]MBD2176091.1 CHAT domain-containing protein [Pseudanabaena sp. FACHB-1998]